MKEKTHRQEAEFSLTALCWRSLSTPGSSGHALYRDGQKGGCIQVNKGAWLVVDSWVWETGLAHLGRSHLQGSSLLVANIQGRKLGRTFSAHTDKGFPMLRASSQWEALPFLHGSASVSNTHSLWTFSNPCMVHYFVLTVGRCYCLHFVHKENLFPHHRIARGASGIPTQQPARLPHVFLFSPL